MIVISILLGLRQHLSEGVIDTKIVWFSGTVKIYFKYLPQLYVLVFFITYLAIWYTFCTEIVLSFFTSWLYLRFFMRNELTKSYGDPSNSFSFAMLFPEIIRTPIEKCTNPIYKLVNINGMLDRVLK